MHFHALGVDTFHTQAALQALLYTFVSYHCVDKSKRYSCENEYKMQSI